MRSICLITRTALAELRSITARGVRVALYEDGTIGSNLVPADNYLDGVTVWLYPSNEITELDFDDDELAEHLGLTLADG
jgi:hypothetical protein